MRNVAAIFVLLLFAFVVSTAAAQPFPRQNGGQQDSGQQVQPLDRIVSAIRRQHPGQLSDVQGPYNGRYEIKWLTPDGRVLLFTIDARTGQVLSVVGEAPFRRQNAAPPWGRNFGSQNYNPSQRSVPSQGFDLGREPRRQWDRDRGTRGSRRAGPEPRSRFQAEH